MDRRTYTREPDVATRTRRGRVIQKSIGNLRLKLEATQVNEARHVKSTCVTARQPRSWTGWVWCSTCRDVRIHVFGNKRENNDREGEGVEWVATAAVYHARALEHWLCYATTCIAPKKHVVGRVVRCGQG